MLKDKLENFILNKRATLLGVGPMSINCVDATIELSNEYDIPLMLIASRRQIDSAHFGGGYVNNWSTEDFSRYVFENDKKGKIILARDHGGPWQNTNEITNNLSLKFAMESAKKSYLADIESGFSILHIDPSIDIHNTPSIDDVLDRIYELYEYCWSEATKRGKEVIFEIGTEEQTGGTSTIDELEYILYKSTEYFKKNNLPKPFFVVVQTGTKVMEDKNIGSFESPIRVKGELPVEIQLPKVIETCMKYGVYLKQHNTDYLTNDSLFWHPRLNIHSANVAPEYGVCETKSFIHLLLENNLETLRDEFLELSYNSRKWEKWMLKNTSATDADRATLSGHYVFAKPEFIDIKKRAQEKIGSKLNVDEYLKDEVKKSIYRYIKNFRLIR